MVECERRAQALLGLHPDLAAMVAWQRGGRSRGRDRCLRSRGCGRGRPGRSVRRCARGRARGCRCPGRRPRCRPTGRRSKSTPRSMASSSEYLIALSRRLPIADTSCRRSPTTVRRGLGSMTSTLMRRRSAPWRTRSTASAITRCTATGSRTGERSTSMRLSSRRSSIVRPTRWASCTSRSDRRWRTGLVVFRVQASPRAARVRRPASSARG